MWIYKHKEVRSNCNLFGKTGVETSSLNCWFLCGHCTSVWLEFTATNRDWISNCWTASLRIVERECVGSGRLCERSFVMLDKAISKFCSLICIHCSWQHFILYINILQTKTNVLQKLIGGATKTASGTWINLYDYSYFSHWRWNASNFHLLVSTSEFNLIKKYSLAQSHRLKVFNTAKQTVSSVRYTRSKSNTVAIHSCSTVQQRCHRANWQRADLQHFNIKLTVSLFCFDLASTASSHVHCFSDSWCSAPDNALAVPPLSVGIPPDV